MLPVWATAIGLGLGFLAAVNLAILAFACYEYAASSGKDPWLRATQVLLAEPGNGRPSIILLHGFGGTPRDFRSLAELLADRGYRVVVPAIPEQTSISFAYSRGRRSPADYRAWLLKLIKDEAAISGAPPMLVGMSMGGALAAIGAADHHVGKLVLVSPYFNLAIADTWITRSVRWLRWIVPVVPKIQKAQISDPEGYRAYATGSYLVSMRAFLQLVELAKIAMGKAPGLALPVLVFASQKDTVASFEATERLFLGREQARMVACNRGNHILTYDYDREPIVAEIVAFLTAEPGLPAANERNAT
jgi:esterase/lipase